MSRWHLSVIAVCITDLDKLYLAKIRNGGLVLGLCQFPLLLQLPQKMMLASKVVKIDSEIIVLLHQSKSVTHSVVLANYFK